MPITLRPATADDEAFLYELYASTRAAEIAAFGWEAPQREMFLRMQFHAQRQHYASYPNTEHQIVLCDDVPIGRLLVARLTNKYNLTDIALLPAACGAGVGGQLVGNLLAEAAQAKVPVTLHVAHGNRARRLYERLGFVATGDDGMYCAMEWRAAQSAA